LLFDHGPLGSDHATAPPEGGSHSVSGLSAPPRMIDHARPPPSKEQTYSVFPLCPSPRRGAKRKNLPLMPTSLASTARFPGVSSRPRSRSSFLAASRSAGTTLLTLRR